ncbi:MAG: methyltransferase domain-containing protein [Pseudomonadota bacterium]
MLKALLKGGLQAGLGHAPGGPALYRRIAWELFGTQATHVDKLARVLPGYCRVWERACGLRLEGLDLWVHEPGGTPFWGLAGFLLTGRPVALTNAEARMLDRHLVRAVHGVLATPLPPGLGSPDRRAMVSACRWLSTVAEALAQVGTRLHEEVDPGAIPLPDASVDLVHSGGSLEHYPQATLEAFLRECRRVLRPGGLLSHVLDHRDHLHHADRSMPFLAHLALPGPVYSALRGHPLGYHNRLSPAEVAELLARVGFEPVALRRMAYPGRRYAADAVVRVGDPGVPAGLLARRFRGLDPLDLRTAAAHYLARRPT